MTTARFGLHLEAGGIPHTHHLRLLRLAFYQSLYHGQYPMLYQYSSSFSLPLPQCSIHAGRILVSLRLTDCGSFSQSSAVSRIPSEPIASEPIAYTMFKPSTQRPRVSCFDGEVHTQASTTIQRDRTQYCSYGIVSSVIRTCRRAAAASLSY